MSSPSTTERHLLPPGFDAHCHLPALRSPPEGVRGLVVAGVSPADWPQQLAHTRALRRRGLVAGATLGIHPWWVAETPEGLRRQLDALKQVLLDRPAGLIGIGETGLDRVHRGVSPAQQEAAFGAQLKLAHESALPVVLHVVRSHAEVMRMLRTVGPPPRGMQVHGFTGSAELVDAWVRLGAFLSVGGAATGSLSARRAAGIRAIPDHLLLVETDAPDQPVATARAAGRAGRPGDLAHVVAAVAAIRGQTPDHVVRVTTANAHRLFGLDMDAPQPT